MKKKVCVITGARAEYGILKPLIFKIKSSDIFDLQVIVTGMHLLDRYGKTIDEIKSDGIEINATVDMYGGLTNESTYYGKALSNGIRGFTEVFHMVKPDIVVVFGDRLEPLAAVLAAATFNIPIAHIHGGDKTDSGHIDENIRHSITRFAHIHFPATEEHARRLEMMGEQPWRIHMVGALGLDTIVGIEKIPISLLSTKMGINLENDYIVLLFHPVGHQNGKFSMQVHEILEALSYTDKEVIAVYPNNDTGSEEIIQELNFYEKNGNIEVFKNIEHELFINLLKYTRVLVGNSSCGIIEAPSLGIPVINVGLRNRDREHAGNVIYVEPKKEEILKAIEKAMNDRDYIERCQACENPYGDGKTSDRIVNLLSSIDLDKNFLRKKITY